MRNIFVVGFVLVLSCLFIANAKADMVMCTMDAMMCPDGSAVGRTGADCSFAPCPEVDNVANIEAIIVGRAESPDPVLMRVLELEREGIVSDVMIMKSYPVQIRLTAPEEIIEELRALSGDEGMFR